MPRIVLPDGSTAPMGDGQSVPTPIAVPGLTDAVQKENIQRDLAFLALGDTSGLYAETIAGISVRPLTTRHLLALTVADSCFVTGKPFDGQTAFGELVKLLRVIAVPVKRRWWQRALTNRQENERIIATAFSGNIERDLDAVKAYFEEAFADVPVANGDHDTRKYYSTAAFICYFMGRELHVPMEQSLDVPLKVVWQIMKVHQRRENPDAILFNPSDSLVANRLAELNQN